MCSLTGVFGLDKSTYEMLYKGAFSQQHRGEDGVGVAVSNGQDIFVEAKLGLVDQKLLEMIERAKKKIGDQPLIGITHTRYPTEGEVTDDNAQPFSGRTKNGWIAYGHNGELTNFEKLKREALTRGVVLTKSSDSEMFLSLYAEAGGKTVEERLCEVGRNLKGAFSIVGITEHTLFAMRDPHGIKPLSIAQLNGGYIISSETTAFLDIEGAQWIGDVVPGEVVTINSQGIQKKQFTEEKILKPCMFELVYFARPDSHIAGRNVHLVRTEFGRELYRQSPVEADIVVAIEDSGRSAAEGFAEESGIPLKRGFIRNHYIGRTFTRPTSILRERGVNLKLSPLKEVLEGKRVVFVDDSIVRGNTAQSRIKLARMAGAKEIYLYITSPRLTNDCYYGIDFHKENMRMTTMPDDAEFMRRIGVDRLVHLSEEGMYRAITRVPLDQRSHVKYDANNFCNACFTGNYPVLKEI
jgi:amidophosphoribosyltransferase